MFTTTGVFKTVVKPYGGLRVFVCEPGWRHGQGELYFADRDGEVPTLEALENMVKENEGYEISGAMRCESKDGKVFGLLVNGRGYVERIDIK